MASASVGDNVLTSDLERSVMALVMTSQGIFVNPMLSEPPTLPTAKEACGKYFCNIVLL